LIQNETTFEPEVVSIAGYLNTKYKEEMFANIVEIHASYEPNTS
jgi:hypothetical protein